MNENGRKNRASRNCFKLSAKSGELVELIKAWRYPGTYRAFDIDPFHPAMRRVTASH